MYTVFRCPKCLLTVYTDFVDDGRPDLNVTDLDDTSLTFYNCPVAICEYHLEGSNNVNLYINNQPGHTMFKSPGFRIERRTYQTWPLRSQSQVASLAFTLDNAQDEPQKPPVPGEPVATKAQTDKAQFVNLQPTYSEPANTQPASTQPASTQPASTQPASTQPASTQPASTQPANTQTTMDIAGKRWTDAEVDMLTGLLNEGRTPGEIAEVTGRSTKAVRYKTWIMRGRGQLPAQGAVKRKIEETE